jgi:thiol-disulfide isomerase/thioredoxin
MWGAVGVLGVAAAVGVIVSVGSEDGESGDEAGAPNAHIGLTAPYVGFDGAQSTLETFAGKPMVVNFFASWCIPCLAELPRFEEVHQELGDEVTFVGLNLQDTVDAGVAVVAQSGITYDVGRDPEGLVFSSFEAFSMPTTVFIGPGGDVVEMWSGELSAAELRQRIEEVLL